jgi:cation diffusion facilitator family transporter
VAVYIFGFGGVFATYQGISHLRHPEPVSHIWWNYAVLGLAAAFDLYSWKISYRELLARKDPDESTWDEIIGSKDPTVFTVFLEDSAALLGILVAFLGIGLGRVFRNPYLDPVASILIGTLLAAVAVLLGRESGALLVGERTNRARITTISETIRTDPAVEKVGELRTMQLGPDHVLLTANVKFHRGMDVQQIESSVKRIEDQIHRQDPTIAEIFIEADPLGGHGERLAESGRESHRDHERRAEHS